MAPLRILISGAGVAGPAVAVWLSRLGHTCTVIERSSNLRTVGQQVDLRKEAIDIVEQMGVLDEIQRHNVDEAGIRLVDAQGKPKLLVPRAEPGEERGREYGSKKFTSEIEIMRGDISRILYDASKEKTEYRFGVMVEEWQNIGDEVEVKLSDGKVERYDLLIAADGQNSRIRRKMMQEEGMKDQSRSLGMHICYFTMPRTPEDESIATCYQAPGRRIVLTRWHKEDMGQGYLGTMAHGEEFQAALKQDVTAQKNLFAKVFEGAGWQTARIVEAMHKADDFYAQEILQRQSTSWSSGRVVLLGDAGQCPSVMTGMGTSLALVAAYVLAGELGKHQGDVKAALEGYEKTFRPFVEQTQKLAPGVPGLMMPETNVEIRIYRALLRLFLKSKLERVMVWIEKGQGVQWKLPKYPELKI